MPFHTDDESGLGVDLGLSTPSEDMEEMYALLEAGSVDGTYPLAWPYLEGVYVFDNILPLTLDDYGYMDTWRIYVKEYDSDSFDELNKDDKEMGIIVTIGGEGYDGSLYRIYSPVFDYTEPSFSAPRWDEDGTTFTATVDYAQNLGLKAKFAADTISFGATFSAYVAEVAAAISLSTAEVAHTFKKIESAGIDEETFDALEGEEAAQTVTVTTTTTTTVGY